MGCRYEVEQFNELVSIFAQDLIFFMTILL